MLFKNSHEVHGTSELVFNVEQLPERDSRGSSRLHAGELISVYDRFTVHNFRQNWRNGAQAWYGSRASVRPRLQRQMCRHPARQHTQSLRHEGKIFKIWSVRTLRDTSALIPLDSRPGSIQLTCLIAIVSSNSATCIQSNVSLIPPDERPTGLRPVLEQNTETNQGLAARLVGELPAQWPRQLQYREFLIRMLWSGRLSDLQHIPRILTQDRVSSRHPDDLAMFFFWTQKFGALMGSSRAAVAAVVLCLCTLTLANECCNTIPWSNSNWCHA